MVKYILLSNHNIHDNREHFAVVDDADFEALDQFTWHLLVDRGNYYVCRRQRVDGKRKRIRMHRQIMGVTDPRVIIDHRDGNGLNNRRGNLNETDTNGNNKNSTKRGDAANVKILTGKRWCAECDTFNCQGCA